LCLVLKSLVDDHLVIGELDGFFGKMLRRQVAHNLTIDHRVLLAAEH